MSYYPPTDWELKDFYREHVDALYRSCCFLTCGEADAQMMVQEIFLKLLNKGMIFSSDKDAKSWMILTACKMSRKPPKPAVDTVAPPEEPQKKEESAEEGLDAPEPSTELTAVPESSLINTGEETSEHQDQPAEASREEETDKEEASPPQESPAQDQREIPREEWKPSVSAGVPFYGELRKLSRKDRFIALLYYCEAYRKSEIADLLGCPTFVIGSRLKRIKKRILQEMGGEEIC